MDIQADAWLTGELGVDAFRVDVGAGLADDPVARKRWAAHTIARRTPSFYYARVSTGRVRESHALEALGFHIVDVNVTLERKPPGGNEKPSASAIDVAPILPGEDAAVLDIAGSAFMHSRFHLDPQIPAASAHKIKRSWIDSYLGGRRGETLLVARDPTGPTGFLAVLANMEGASRIQVIDLIAVAPRAQGKGIGQALVQHFIQRARGRCDRLRVGTQAANIPSLRLYERCGFAVARTEYVLHAHVSPKKADP